MGRFGKVAVLLGGTSAERDVSLKSGQAILAALQRQKVEAHAIDAVPGFIAKLLEGKFDRVFIALHGRGGEDGTVQGLLELLGIPYTGSGILGSALAMDKHRAKRIWQSLGLPTLPYQTIEPGQDPSSVARAIGFPLAVKPTHEGSSVGVFRVERFFEVHDAVKQAGQFGQVILEKWIDGAEYTVGIVSNQLLPVIKVTPKQGFYDYRAKYITKDTHYMCPSDLSKQEEKTVQRLSMEAFEALGCSEFGRVDLIRDPQGDFWLLEVNTIPGFTDTSLVPKAAQVAGMEFDELVLTILQETLRETRKRKIHV